MSRLVVVIAAAGAFVVSTMLGCPAVLAVPRMFAMRGMPAVLVQLLGSFRTFKFVAFAGNAHQGHR